MARRDLFMVAATVADQNCILRQHFKGLHYFYPRSWVYAVGTAAGMRNEMEYGHAGLAWGNNQQERSLRWC